MSWITNLEAIDVKISMQTLNTYNINDFKSFSMMASLPSNISADTLSDISVSLWYKSL